MAFKSCEEQATSDESRPEVTTETKQCRDCKEFKFPHEFSFHRRKTRKGLRVQLHNRCVPCYNAYQREKAYPNKLEHYRRNRQRYNEISKNYRRSNKDKVLDQHLRYTYGITLEDYLEMVQQQEGGCKICRNPPTEKNCRRGRLAVDHCHQTGKIRGLLCDHCNHGIGSFKDSTELLKAAIGYLERGRADGTD